MKQEVIKKEIKAEENLGSFGDIESAISESRDGKDKAITDIVENLFSEEKLLMISRLDKHLAYYMVKHVIIKHFFYDIYLKCSYSVEWRKATDYPYYKRFVTENRAPITMIQGAYDQLLNKLLMITISYDGKGREEMLGVLRALRNEVEEENQLQQTLKRFY